MTSPRLPRRYWRLWTASAISNIGDGMNVAALPLLAYSLTDDSRILSLVSFASFLPWFVFALPVGVYVDRFDRQRLMISANLLRGSLFAVIAVTAWTGTLGMVTLLGLLVIVGCCEVVFDSSSQALLPSVVEDEQLPRANGVLYATEVVCNGFIGLPFGAWLWVAAIGIPFGVNAAALALAALLVGSIRSQPVTVAHASHGFVPDLREGLEWLWRHRLLRTLAVLLGVTNMAATFGGSILVKFAAEELGVSNSGFGLLLALMSIGSVIGGLLGDRIASHLGSKRALVSAYSLFGLTEIGIGLARSAVVVAAFSVVQGLAGTVWNVITVSMRQRVIPPELFGRVNSAYRWIGTGSIGLGALIGGQIAYRFDLRAPYLVGGTVTLLALAAMLRTLVTSLGDTSQSPST